MKHSPHRSGTVDQGGDGAFEGHRRRCPQLHVSGVGTSSDVAGAGVHRFHKFPFPVPFLYLNFRPLNADLGIAGLAEETRPQG